MIPGWLLAACVLGSLVKTLIAEQLPPPAAPQIPVTEAIHGVSITDNYRWLEDQNSPQTRGWIAAEQKYTGNFFAGLPARAAIRASLDKMERVESVSVPFVANGRYFFTRRLASEEQACLLLRDSRDGRDEALVNPNTLFPDHSVSVSIADVSRDGKILAYRFRKGGRDETEIHFLDVSSKKDLPDLLPSAIYFVLSRYAFALDKTAFYYARFSAAGTRVYRHDFGTPASKDQEIFGSAYGPEYGAACGITSTGKYLFCEATKGATGVEGDLYIQGQGEKALRPIVQKMQLILGTAPHRDHLFVLTGWQAPKEEFWTSI
jgi:prolyl oligopeptidase